MKSFLEDLLGIKDLRGPAGLLPRRAILHFMGAQVSASDDAVNDETVVTVAAAAAPVLISPPVLGPSVFQYAPTGWSTADVVRLTSNAPAIISGFGLTTAAPRKTLVNVGAYTITLEGQYINELRSQRLYLPNGADDYDIGPNGVVDVLHVSGYGWYLIP